MAVSPGGRPADDSPLGTGDNWVTRSGGLPVYFREVAHALLRSGRAKDESTAIQMAIAAVKRWAAGGDHVRPQVQAAAVKALAQWEAMKASHSHTNERATAIELARKQKLPAVANKLHGHAKRHRTRAIRMYKAGDLTGARKAWATAKKIDALAKGSK